MPPPVSFPLDLKFLFHVKHPAPSPDSLRAASAALGVGVSASQAALLLRLEDLLIERAIPLGAVAASDRSRIRERHTLDCLRAAAEVVGARSAYDLGSGAGLPGLVIAIAVPDLRVGLVEPRQRRAAFLELAVQELGLANARVLVQRVEALTEPVECCFARAFAPPERTWAACADLLSPQGRLVYFAGAGRGKIRAPSGARIVAVRRNAVLESAGPLVIMARQ